MKKYLALFNIALAQSFAYRAETALWIVLDIFPFLITIITWIAVYTTHSGATAFTLSELTLYYLALLLVNNLTQTHFDERWVDNVIYGRVDHLLTKPLGFIQNMIVIQLSNKVLGFFTFLIPAMLISTVLAHLHIIQLPALRADAIAAFIALLCLAFAMNCVLSAFIVLAAFWFEQAHSLSHTKWVLAGVFGGSIAPLAFYPQSLQSISRYLPFSRMLALPATIFSQQQIPTTIWADFSILLAYTIGGFLMVGFFWKQALKHYSAVGG